jgi:hypothetical protein
MYVLYFLHKKTHFGANKMKNGLFMPRKGKHPKSTLFAIPRCTHVHNMGSSKSIIGAPPMASHSDFRFLAFGSLPRRGSQPSIHGKNFLQQATAVPCAPAFLPVYH